MRLDLACDQSEFNAMSPKEQIDVLCDVHECQEKTRKIHFDLYVNKRWNPHPPSRFVQWWRSAGARYTEKKTGRGWSDIDEVRAFNCEAVRESYSEAKQVGLV